MAKVLLIQPIYNPYIKNNPLWIPLPLIFIGSIVKDKGHVVRIIDRNLYTSDEYLINAIKQFSPDIIGLSAFIGKPLIDLIKTSKIIKENSDAIVVVGGVQATIEPQLLLDVKSIDYVIRGEGELAMLEICDLIDKGKKDFSKILNINLNPMRPFIDLNKYPLPDYNLIEVKKYPRMTFITSRGCPGNCTFCYNNYFWGKLGRKCLRMYNAENAIKMITEVVEKYKIREYTILDDNFADLSKRCSDICNSLSKLDSIFQCELRADFTHDEIMKQLKKANCWSVQFGIESGSQRILDFIKKGVTVEQNAKAIKQCKKFKIFSDGSYMLGLPGETIDEMKLTIDFINKNKTDAICAKKFTPFPGTEIFDYCVNKNLLKKPTTIEDYFSYEFTNSPEPNVSEIPTELLMNTVKEYSYGGFDSYMKKAVMLLKGGHFSYVYWKLKERILK
jgi:anaerobic magnesium-protoporphyrin IX monomethyl ester cyclase